MHTINLQILLVTFTIKEPSEKSKLVCCLLFHKKLDLQSLQVSSAFKVISIFIMLPCGEILLSTNSIHVSLILS